MTDLRKWALELNWDGLDILPLGEFPSVEIAQAIYSAACVEIQKLRGPVLQKAEFRLVEHHASFGCGLCGGAWENAAAMQRHICDRSDCPYLQTLERIDLLRRRIANAEANLTPLSPGVKTPQQSEE